MAKKIMFNDRFLLTGAVLEGRKTQTRRLIGQKLLDKIELFRVDYYNLTFDALTGKDLIEAYFINFPNELPFRVGRLSRWRRVTKQYTVNLALK